MRSVMKTLEARGLISQSTRAENSPVPPGSAVYCGFDPTADSLHVGNLIAIVTLLHFRAAGYHPIAVVGGATGLIGDPSGRTKERDKMAQETVAKNLCGISENLERISRNHELLVEEKKPLPPLKLLNNAHWYEGVNIIHFLSDILRPLRLNTFLKKDSVSQRNEGEEGMCLTEFLYPALQAYDFLQLHKQHNCWMQVGGSDQWGNISIGYEYVRKLTGSEVQGLTTPLLLTSTGEKIGKSAGNAVWLSPHKTTSYSLYQYFVKMADSDTERLLKYFTFLPLEEIESIMQAHRSQPELRTAQKVLAENVTKLVHGMSGLETALTATAALFGDPEALASLPESSFEDVFVGVPSGELSHNLCADGKGLSLAEVAVKSGAVPSKKEAQKMINWGSFRVNNVLVQSPLEKLDPAKHILKGRFTVLRVGKSRYHLVKWK
eukprot:Em0019g872a